MALTLTNSASVEDFIREVARRTGLDARVVKAWVLAENGHLESANARNPLNIRTGPFASVPAAIDATVRLLTGDPRYAPIIRAARTGDAAAQIAAITASPWDSCHYRGLRSDGTCTSSPPGTLLKGTYARAGVGEVLTDPAGAAAGFVEDKVTGLVGGVIDWAEDKAKVALAYVGLTILALALGLLGLQLATGAPGAAVRLAATRGRSGVGGQSGDIPF